MKKLQKKEKKPTRAKILKSLDKLWSEIVRIRDNKCMLCGGHYSEIKSLQAHHFIISRGKSLKYRFDIRNGISLCYGCHIHQVHTNPTIDIINRVRESAIVSGIVTDEEIDEIASTSRSINKLGIGELLSIEENLIKELESFKNR